MREYATQMDAARKGIITPEMETVAKKEPIKMMSPASVKLYKSIVR